MVDDQGGVVEEAFLVITPSGLKDRAPIVGTEQLEFESHIL